MPDGIPPAERLDLRFRAVPVRQQRSWLPGSVWLWFGVGLLSGSVGWQYSQHLLKKQLGHRLQSDSHPGEAILALEALEVLDSSDPSAFFRGILHPDHRVAKSATQKLLRRIEDFSHRDLDVYHAELRSLGSRLDQIPKDLPEETRMLICSLAARVYSACLVINDRQLQPTLQICHRWIIPGNGVSMQDGNYTHVNASLTIPPEPLPSVTNDPLNFSDAFPHSSEALSERHFNRHPSEPVISLVSNTHDPARAAQADDSSWTTPSTTQFESLRVMESSAEAASRAPSLVDPSSIDALDFPPEVTSHPDKSHAPLELPVLVSTPASIASQPVVRMKLVSNQPNLQGIEKAEIAELVRLLGNEQTDVAKGAALALRHKGFTDTEIELASELAIGSVTRRIELIQQIAKSNQLSPRPWLVWMAEDGQPEVRRLSISLLSSMQTEDVQRSLRMLLHRETDQEIKDLIRRVLLSGSRR